MASIGPQIPSTATDKRKWHEDAAGSESDSDREIGPAPPTVEQPAAKKARSIGPTLPASMTMISNPNSQSQSSKSGDESSDDDFGPSLPTATEAANKPSADNRKAGPSVSNVQGNARLKRDDWMTVAPSGGDWSARVDPTKLKNRRFNTGKGAKASSTDGNGSVAWHETPAEKQARLQREMMGIQEKSGSRDTSKSQAPDKVDEETARRMREYNKSRGPTLYDTHQDKADAEKEDDPSARAFDREKDIGGGLQIKSTQRRDLMKKASDFSSRFGSAKYL